MCSPQTPQGSLTGGKDSPEKLTMMTVLQQEMSLVSDLLYLLIGIEGQHIKADPLDSANAERTFKIEVKMVTLTRE